MHIENDCDTRDSLNSEHENYMLINNPDVTNVSPEEEFMGFSSNENINLVNLNTINSLQLIKMSIASEINCKILGEIDCVEFENNDVEMNNVSQLDVDKNHEPFDGNSQITQIFPSSDDDNACFGIENSDVRMNTVAKRKSDVVDNNLCEENSKINEIARSSIGNENVGDVTQSVDVISGDNSNSSCSDGEGLYFFLIWAVIK